MSNTTSPSQGSKIDPRSVAHLDKNTGLRVLCGSCSKPIAAIAEWVDQYGDVHRVLLLQLGWRRRVDGVWSLTKHARRIFDDTRRHGEGTRRASARHQDDVVSQLVTRHEVDLSRQEWRGLAEEGHWYPFRLITELPPKILCPGPGCGSEQTLTAERLRVDTSVIVNLPGVTSIDAGSAIAR